MSRILPLLSAISITLSIAAGLFADDTGDVFILEDFDGNAASGVISMTEGQLVDVDGNGDREGRFVTVNFSQVVRLKLERGGELIDRIMEYPVLAYTIAAVPGRNEGTFLQTMVQVMTNAKGGVYNVFPESRTPLSRNGIPSTVRLNLLEAKTQDGVSLKELIKAFKDGDGSSLTLNITQQSSKDAITDCVYDDIRLEKATD